MWLSDPLVVGGLTLLFVVLVAACVAIVLGLRDLGRWYARHRRLAESPEVNQWWVDDQDLANQMAVLDLIRRREQVPAFPGITVLYDGAPHTILGANISDKPRLILLSQEDPDGQPFEAHPLNRIQYPTLKGIIPWLATRWNRESVR